jgi:hypothetical protein
VTASQRGSSHAGKAPLHYQVAFELRDSIDHHDGRSNGAAHIDPARGRWTFGLPNCMSRIGLH